MRVLAGTSGWSTRAGTILVLAVGWKGWVDWTVEGQSLFLVGTHCISGTAFIVCHGRVGGI